MSTTSRLIVQNLDGVFTGDGFVSQDGRKPEVEHAGFRKGPLHLEVDLNSGKLIAIHKTLPTINESSQVFDGKGLWASSAFIDSHTHSLFAGTRAREYFMRWGGETYLNISRKGGGIHNSFTAMDNTADEILLRDFYTRLHKMREHGTLCVEVKSGYAATPEGELRMLRLIQKAKNDPLCPVRIRSTFLPLHALPKGEIEDDYVSKMMALLPIVSQENLADHIDAFPEEGFFCIEQSLRFAREALKHGLHAKIHADEITSMKAVENFIPLEAYSVDHLQKITPEAIKELAYVPTVATLMPATSFYLHLEYAPARKIIDAGARFALASDFNPGTAPEAKLQLTALLAATHMKLSATEIFCALTYGAAASMRLEKESGHLASGTRADFLLWDTQSSALKESTGQGLLEEVFAESVKPKFSFLGGKTAFAQNLLS